MAINNGRYIVTGGFKEPDGTIVKEGQWVPATTQASPLISGVGSPRKYVNGVLVNGNTFTPAETYRLQADGYANQGNTALADAYGNIANNLGAYSNFANNSLNSYDALLNYIRGNEQGLQSVAGNLYGNLVNDIQSQRDYINQTFGPEGTLTQEVNTYYDDLGNYLATDAGRQAARIAAQGMHSGASLGAIRAQQNEAYNESFARYIQAKEQQINAKQQLASNLINYMSQLRQEYGDTTNQYVIELYKRANDMYNSIAQSANKDMIEYNNLRLTRGSNGNTYYYDIWGNLVDNAGNIIKTRKQLQEEETILNLSTIPTDENGNQLYGPYKGQFYNLENIQKNMGINTNGTGYTRA